MCDLMLQEAKVMLSKATRKPAHKTAQVALMPSSSFLLSPTDLTTRFCYVNFEVGHKLADLYSDADKNGVYKTKTKMTNQVSWVINSSSHKLAM